MKTIELKSNIMCGACVAKVTPVLDELIGAGKWKVNTLDPKKILSVSVPGVDTAEVIAAVERAGYKAEKL